MLLLIDLKNILKLLKINHYYGQSSTNYNFYKNKKVQTLMLGPFKLGYITEGAFQIRLNVKSY